MAILRRLVQAGFDFGIKINTDAIVQRGIEELIPLVSSVGKPLFMDTKLLCPGDAMANVARIMVQRGVRYFTVMAGAQNQVLPVMRVTQRTNTKVLWVTTLTQFSDQDHAFFNERSLSSEVLMATEMGNKFKVDGFVVPGTVAEKLFPALDDCVRVVTGIRPTWYSDIKTHAQSVTPQQAVAAGADILVIGDPIMGAEDPAEAFHLVQEEIRSPGGV